MANTVNIDADPRRGGGLYGFDHRGSGILLDGVVLSGRRHPLRDVAVVTRNSASADPAMMCVKAPSRTT